MVMDAIWGWREQGIRGHFLGFWHLLLVGSGAVFGTGSWTKIQLWWEVGREGGEETTDTSSSLPLRHPSRDAKQAIR